MYSRTLERILLTYKITTTAKQPLPGEKCPNSCEELCLGEFRAGLAMDSRAERCLGEFRADLATDSRAERCLGEFRAGLATDSRAGGYIFIFQVEHFENKLKSKPASFNVAYGD